MLSIPTDELTFITTYSVKFSILSNAFVVSIVLIVKRQTNDDEQDDKVLAYTELVKEIQNKNVEKIEMTVGSTTLKVKLKDEEEEKKAIIPNTQVFMELIQSQTLEGNEIKLEQTREIARIGMQKLREQRKEDVNIAIESAKPWY